MPKFPLGEIALSAMFLGVSCMSAQADLPGNSARATRYDVTVTKVELCTDASCSSSQVIGSGTKVFNIASVSVGAQVGGYARLNSLATGTTYSYVRVTLNPQIIIVATGTDDIGAACNTDSTNAASSPTTLGQAIAVAPSAQTVFVPAINGFAAGRPSAADFSNPFRITRNATDLSILYPISPFTVKATTPTVKVKFNTSTAVKFFDPSGVGNPALKCSVYPAPPSVSIDIQ